MVYTVHQVKLYNIQDIYIKYRKKPGMLYTQSAANSLNSITTLDF